MRKSRTKITITIFCLWAVTNVFANAELKQKIKSLADKIYDQTDASQASDENLRTVKRNLRQSLGLLNGSGGGSGSTQEFTSQVNTSCLDNIYGKTPGNLPLEYVTKWAHSCRNFDINGNQCLEVKGEANSTCYQNLYGKISGSFPPDMTAKVEKACKTITVKCRVGSTKLESKVDLACLSRQYSSIPGRATADQAIGWTHSCRGTTPDPNRCKIVSGNQNLACINKLHGFIPGHFTHAQAAEAAVSCRDLVFSCRI